MLSIALLGGCSGCPQQAVPVETESKPAQLVDATAVIPAKPLRLRALFTDKLDAVNWGSWVHNLAKDKSRLTPGAGGLYIDLETYGRAADEVSVVALAWKEPIDFLGGPQTVTVALDWLEDSNASYLSAGLALIPEDAPLRGDPRDLTDVSHVSFIGAGMGAHARRELLVQRHGQEAFRDTEGWPEVGREGRKLATAELKLTIDGQSIRLEEAGRDAVTAPTGLGFARGRLVLFVASHSNSMRRAVRFTKLELR